MIHMDPEDSIERRLATAEWRGRTDARVEAQDKAMANAMTQVQAHVESIRTDMHRRSDRLESNQEKMLSEARTTNGRITALEKGREVDRAVGEQKHYTWRTITTAAIAASAATGSITALLALLLH